MSEQSLDGGLSWHRVRISSDPDQMPSGVAVSIVDAKTGEPIPNAFKAVITLDATDVNKVEITYYEHDEHGKLIVKDDEPVIRTVTSNDPEVDITAFEVRPVLKPRHDGTLDDHDTVHVYYNNFDGIAISAGEPVWLTAQQALSLFAWLQQEKPTLERLVKEVQGERG